MADTFRAATWNVGGHDTTTVADVLGHNDPDLIGLQEAPGRIYADLLTDLGYNTHATGWCRTAWSGDWTRVRSWSTRLSETPWTSGDGQRVLYVDADTTILSDPQGRTVTLLSFKLPPHIQPTTRVAKRVTIASQALAALDEAAENALTAGFLTFSDDNYDAEAGLDVPRLEPLIGSSTVLRLHRPPEPTLGNRSVDVIRTIRRTAGGRLAPTPNATVTGPPPTPATHRIYTREFRWT